MLYLCLFEVFSFQGEFCYVCIFLAIHSWHLYDISRVFIHRIFSASPLNEIFPLLPLVSKYFSPFYVQIYYIIFADNNAFRSMFIMLPQSSSRRRTRIADLHIHLVINRNSVCQALSQPYALIWFTAYFAPTWTFLYTPWKITSPRA